MRRKSGCDQRRDQGTTGPEQCGTRYHQRAAGSYLSPASAMEGKREERVQEGNGLSSARRTTTRESIKREKQRSETYTRN
eukprot:5366445-Heterocapsa_arctica.AAC.1